MLEKIDHIEKAIYAVLMILLIIVLVAGIIDLAWLMVNTLWVDTPYSLASNELIALLGAFLLVLIGVELLDTIKIYFRENAIHVEIVVLLAVIAVARKVILLDPSSMSGFEYGFELMSIGVIVLCLAASYYLIKTARITIGPDGIRRS